VDLPREKRSDIGLTYVFGIGREAARQILDKAGINGAIRVKDLSEDQIVKIREIIDQDHQVEGDLRKTVSMNIKRLIDTGTYRGLGIAKVCRFAVNGPKPMHAREKAVARESAASQNQPLDRPPRRDRHS
jgi:small subunit ribosomal protein S13